MICAACGHFKDFHGKGLHREFCGFPDGCDCSEFIETAEYGVFVLAEKLLRESGHDPSEGINQCDCLDCENFRRSKKEEDEKEKRFRVLFEMYTEHIHEHRLGTGKTCEGCISLANEEIRHRVSR